MTRLPRRPLVVGGVLAVLVAVAVLAVLVTAGGGGPTGTTAASSSTAGTAGTTTGPAPSGSVTPAGAGPTTVGTTAPGTTAPGTAVGGAATGPGATGAAADQLPPERPPVSLDASATDGGGLTGRLVSVEAVQTTGTGVGNVSGPGLRVTVELMNSTALALPLDGSYVELTTGPDAAPASPVDDPAAAPLQGEVPAGGPATGVYVFAADPAPGTEVTVRVQQAPGAPFLVFRGTLG